MISSLRSLLFLYSAIFFILTLNRTALYWIYPEYFNEKSALLSAIVSAIRYDIQTATYLLIIPVLMFLFPCKASFKSKIKGFALHLGFVLILISVLVLIGDNIYFGIVSRHAYHDVSLLLAESSSILPLLFNDFLLVSIGSFVLIMASIIFWYKHWKQIFINNKHEHSFIK